MKLENPLHHGHYIKSVKIYSVQVPVYEALGKSAYGIL